MDGFELKDNIILIAATNRPDILDPALLRPALRPADRRRPPRPERPQEDPRGAREGQASGQIELDTLAAGTPGFTGADLANLVNEAALLARAAAARRSARTSSRKGSCA